MPTNNKGYCAYCGKWKQKEQINYTLIKPKCHACIEKVKQRNQQMKGPAMKSLKLISGFIALLIFAAFAGFFAAMFLILVNNQQPNWLAISACGLGFFVFLIATINTLFEKAD